MAKRKGKSRSRVRNLQQRLHEGADVDAAPSRAKLTERAVKLPSHRLEAPEQNLDELPKVDGLVLGQFPGGVLVRADLPGGREDLLCGIAKTFRAAEDATALAPCDRVTVALSRPEASGGRVSADRDRADGMILSRQPRRTALSRPEPRSGKRRSEWETEIFEKVIVANVDVLVVVAATCRPPLRRGLIDRFLIIAERGGLEAMVAMNKIDLAGADDALVADLQRLEIPVIACSAATAEGVEALAGRLAGRRSVLAGASGVGKSTLINAMIPGAEAQTNELRAKDQRGRHTTSAAMVYEMPSGGQIVDTPGLRELSITLDATELPWYFPEIARVAHACRFNDCTHTHEPRCAVREAVEAGEINPARYESYLRILDSRD